MARSKGRARRARRPARKGRKGYKTNNNLKSLNPIAQRYICKMKYAESVQTDASGRFVFNLNSIFDPNATGVGHQPYGHDTLATLYNRYRVISCSYRVIAPNASSNLQMGVVPANEIITFGTVAELKENPRARYIVQTPGGPIQPVSGRVYMPSLTGRTKSQYMADDRYQATFGTSPAEQMVLNILTTSQLDIPLTSNALIVELVYTVECFDIKNLAQS